MLCSILDSCNIRVNCPSSHSSVEERGNPMETSHTLTFFLIPILFLVIGTDNSLSQEKTPRFTGKYRQFENAVVGDFLEYSFHSLTEWPRRGPKERKEIQAKLRIEVLEKSKGITKVGIRVDYQDSAAESVDPKVRELLTQGVYLPFELTKPAGDKENNSRSPDSPGDKEQEELVAAGFSWQCSKYVRDTRPRDGPLTVRWITSEIGPLYLTGGLVKRLFKLSGFGASGGSTLLLTALGNDSKAGSKNKTSHRPYFISGSWFVEEVTESDGKNKSTIRHSLRHTELHALADTENGPLIRTRTTSYFPSTKSQSKRGSSDTLKYKRRIYNRSESVEVNDELLSNRLLPDLLTKTWGPYIKSRWTRKSGRVKHPLLPIPGWGGINARMLLERYDTQSEHEVYDEHGKTQMRKEIEVEHHLADLSGKTATNCPLPLFFKPWYLHDTVFIDDSVVQVEEKRLITFGIRPKRKHK